MESFLLSLKTERTERETYRTRNEARADVFDYIERFYTSIRRHSTIGYDSLVEFERTMGLAPGVHQTGSSSVFGCCARRSLWLPVFWFAYHPAQSTKPKSIPNFFAANSHRGVAEHLVGAMRSLVLTAAAAMDRRTHQSSPYRGNFFIASAKSSGSGFVYDLPVVAGVWPVIASLYRSSIPVRAACALNVCRHAWFGLSSGSVIPSERTHAPRRPRARSGGLCRGFSLAGAEAVFLSAS